MKKKDIALKNEYKKCFEYLKDSKKFFYIVICVFLFSFIFGYLIMPPEEISQEFLKYIEKLILLIEGKSLFELISFIFLNNLQSGFFSMLFGVFFGIFPFFAIILNGYFLGFVSKIIVEQEGGVVLFKLIPHGIFEIPAIFISFALGLKLGTFIFNKDKKKVFFDYLRNSLRIFFLIVFPLLIIAAVIEGTFIFLT